MNFAKISRRISHEVGRPYVFFGACTGVFLWVVSGPIFGFSDTWQLVINTSTTIITFLMVFLIQSSQNTDTDAIQKKLDELIHSDSEADDHLAGIENNAPPG